jgi:hypothetical protein
VANQAFENRRSRVVSWAFMDLRRRGAENGGL